MKPPTQEYQIIVQNWFPNKLRNIFTEQSSRKSSITDGNSKFFKSIFRKETSQWQKGCSSISLSTELTTSLEVSNIQYWSSSLFIHYVRVTSFLLYLLSISSSKIQNSKETEKLKELKKNSDILFFITNKLLVNYFLFWIIHSCISEWPLTRFLNYI